MSEPVEVNEIVDLTELSDAEDDLVVCQVSLPSSHPSARAEGSRFGRRHQGAALEQMPQQQQPTSSARLLLRHEPESVPDFPRQSRLPAHPSYGGLTSLRPAGPASHAMSQNQYPVEASSHRRDILNPSSNQLSLTPSGSSAMASFGGNAMSAGTPPYESQFHPHHQYQHQRTGAGHQRTFGQNQVILRHPIIHFPTSKRVSKMSKQASERSGTRKRSE